MEPFILLSGLQLRRLSDSHERSVNPLMFPDLLRRRRLSKQPMRKQTKSSSSSQASAGSSAGKRLPNLRARRAIPQNAVGFCHFKTIFVRLLLNFRPSRILLGLMKRARRGGQIRAGKNVQGNVCKYTCSGSQVCLRPTAFHILRVTHE